MRALAGACPSHGEAGGLHSLTEALQLLPPSQPQVQGRTHACPDPSSATAYLCLDSVLVAEDGAVLFQPPPANGECVGSPSGRAQHRLTRGEESSAGVSLLGSYDSFFLAPELAEERLVTEKVPGASSPFPSPAPSPRGCHVPHLSSSPSSGLKGVRAALPGQAATGSICQQGRGSGRHTRTGLGMDSTSHVP